MKGAILDQSLGLQQKQQLTMSPLLQESINILQLAAVDIQDYVLEFNENNPFVTLDGGGDEEAGDESGSAYAQVDYEDETATSDYAPVINDEDGEYTISLAEHNAAEELEYQPGGQYLQGEEQDDPVDLASADLSLHEVIEAQLGYLHLSAADTIIAARLIEALEGTGYLAAELDMLATQLRCGGEKIVQVLTQLQALEPAGVFARTLAECLGLQLKARQMLDNKFKIMLANLELIAKSEWHKLANLCKVTLPEIEKMIHVIKSLNPKPGLQYKHESVAVLVPDVVVTLEPKNNFRIDLTPETMPKINLYAAYYSDAKHASAKVQDRAFLRQKWREAKWLQSSLAKRADSMLKVAKAIVEWQLTFFTKGVEFMQPMSLSDIAQKTELHESTVSRICRDKWMTTPMGNFQLRYFFSQEVCTVIQKGAESISSRSIKDKLKRLIESERPEMVLTDEALAKIFAEQNIQLARRTIAKYREELGISTSQLRKRKKRLHAAVG